MTRNGHARPRTITTAAGPVEIRAPRVNDRRVDPTRATGSSSSLRSCRRGRARAPRWPRCCHCCTCMACSKGRCDRRRRPANCVRSPGAGRPGQRPSAAVVDPRCAEPVARAHRGERLGIERGACRPSSGRSALRRPTCSGSSTSTCSSPGSWRSREHFWWGSVFLVNHRRCRHPRRYVPGGAVLPDSLLNVSTRTDGGTRTLTVTGELDC